MDSRVEELSNRSLRVYEPLEPVKTGGWENDRYCTWPQEVIIKLDVRTQVSHILIISKEDRSIPECQFYLGDGLSGTFDDCPYRFAGSGSHIIEESPK
jgi:hypothetical protein